MLIDPRSLDTLPDRFYRDGMAEVIKYGCIQNAVFFFEELEGFFLQAAGRGACSISSRYAAISSARW